MRVAGTFLLQSSSADTCICIGFVPDWVKVYSMNANEEIAHWSIHMQRHASTLAGITIDDDGAVTADTFDTGIKVHKGGHIVTATEKAAHTYIGKDDLDYSKAANAGSGYSDISTWTLYSGQTGTWNAGCNTTYVGVGSVIRIDGVRYTIAALTNDGDADGEVTLDATAVPSGDVQYISNMYDYTDLATGSVTPAGFYIDATSNVLNATSEIAWFEAGVYDN